MVARFLLLSLHTSEQNLALNSLHLPWHDKVPEPGSKSVLWLCWGCQHPHHPAVGLVRTGWGCGAQPPLREISVAFAPHNRAAPRFRAWGVSPIITQLQRQASATSTPRTSAPQRVQNPCGGLSIPTAGVSQPHGGASAHPQVPAGPRALVGQEKWAARFLLSPWSRRDMLGNPITVRLRRRVDLGFIAVSVLNRE